MQELLRNGTTTAMVFATTHKASVDAIFEAADARSMRLVAGKVLMDRNVPEQLRDAADGGYEDSVELIERWHDRSRLSYAVTPRFAPTSTERQLELCGRLLDRHPGVYLQSHVAENRCGGRLGGRALSLEPQLSRRLRSLRPAARAHGLRALHPRRPRGPPAHGGDRRRDGVLPDVEPLPRQRTVRCAGGVATTGVRVGIGTDIGGGTSFSMLRTLDEAYKVCQLAGNRLSPLRAFYLATLGGAAALDLDDRIGNFDAGKEADFVVLDPGRDAAARAPHRAAAETLAERLFALMILGDDRAVHATHVLGAPAMAGPLL